jgi:hypothetical protein
LLGCKEEKKDLQCKFPLNFNPKLITKNEKRKKKKKKTKSPLWHGPGGSMPSPEHYDRISHLCVSLEFFSPSQHYTKRFI